MRGQRLSLPPRPLLPWADDHDARLSYGSWSRVDGPGHGGPVRRSKQPERWRPHVELFRQHPRGLPRHPGGGGTRRSAASARPVGRLSLGASRQGSQSRLCPVHWGVNTTRGSSCTVYVASLYTTCPTSRASKRAHYVDIDSKSRNVSGACKRITIARCRFSGVSARVVHAGALACGSPRVEAFPRPARGSRVHRTVRAADGTHCDSRSECRRREGG